MDGTIRACRYRYARTRPSAFTRVRSADGCTFFPPPPQPPQPPPQPSETNISSQCTRGRRHRIHHRRDITTATAAVKQARPRTDARHLHSRVYGARLPSTMRPHQLPLRLCSLMLSLSVVTAATGYPQRTTDDPATNATVSTRDRRSASHRTSRVCAADHRQRGASFFWYTHSRQRFYDNGTLGK